MSKVRDVKDSDDEFEDALSDVPTGSASGGPSVSIKETSSGSGASVPDSKSNEEFLEEITRQANDLKLPDETEEATTTNELGDSEQQEEEAQQNVDELIEDIDEESLRERDKSLSEEELKENKAKAERMKLQGNEHFKNDESERAIEVYTEALEICPTTEPKERAILYGNRAAAKIKSGAKKAAMADCNKAVELWPEYVRVLLRRAKLHEYEEKLEEALEDYKRVYELDPGQREAREAMARLPPIINERNERLKEEMMSKLKDLGNMILKPFGLSTENFQMQQDPNTGSYSINFNQGSR